MNNELIQLWINKVLSSFSFRCQHLIWDSYKCHIEESVKSSLYAKKKYIQTPDVSWKKPFKALAKIRQMACTGRNQSENTCQKLIDVDVHLLM